MDTRRSQSRTTSGRKYEWKGSVGASVGSWWAMARAGSTGWVIDGMGRRILSALACCVALCLAAQPAMAQSGAIQQAAVCLSNQPVCSQPGANPGLTSSQVSALSQRIEREGAGPMHIAVLPKQALDEAGGSMDALLTELAGEVNQSGAYVAVVQRHLTAFSAGNEPIDVAPLATAVVQSHHGQSVNAVLTSLVDRIAAARQAAPVGAPGGGGGGSGGLGVGWIVLIVAAFLLLGVTHLRRRRMQQAAE